MNDTEVLNVTLDLKKQPCRCGHAFKGHSLEVQVDEDDHGGLVLYVVVGPCSECPCRQFNVWLEFGLRKAGR